MSTASLYESIHRDNIAFIRDGDIIVDTYLGNGVTDLRRGISLIIPLSHISKNYESIVQGFQMLEPSQYYYPLSDLHITVFDLISANPMYAPSNSVDDTFVAIANEVLAPVNRFSVTFKGIVFSREAGLFTGYDDGSVVALRESIRGQLLQQGIPNTERYKSKSVHSTFFRFAKPLANSKIFAGAIENHREIEIGNEPVQSVSLIEHDWYNRKNSIRTIKAFMLK
jgi:2'-5' RNA ligase